LPRPKARGPEDYCNLGSKISRTDSFFELDRPSHELSQDEDGELAGSVNFPGELPEASNCEDLQSRAFVNYVLL
jgi:hypothetical protein